MFMPDNYAENDIEIQKQHIRDTGLGTVISTTADGHYNANHIPFVLEERPDGKLFLLAHFHIKNDIGTELANANETLIIFQGRNGYVTPSWYPTKQETHKVAPTWVYSTVHVYGKPRVIKDKDEIHKILEKLTNHFEAQSSKKKTWSVDEAPEAYLDMAKKFINGLEIEVTKMVGKFKMNQSQPPKDLKGTIDGFKSRTNDLYSLKLGETVAESSERYEAKKAAKAK
ncbi:hypothetical protein D0Z00_001287 [Geotrichum galactomycetum]|uniref:Uncharacterized protein n=1 Tax=Geotrichum galactomycetum TaxID=27317 RepID=A0ACB6V7E0_9ASCO|nr:hypothetical protein D0Z00_001287 [Geotrichum candidum]